MKIPFFKKEKSFKKKNLQFNPSLYWELVIFSSLIIVILSVFYGYYLFNQINIEHALLASDNYGQVPQIDQGGLQKVLDYFSNREKKSVEIINSPSPIVDPSL